MNQLVPGDRVHFLLSHHAVGYSKSFLGERVEAVAADRECPTGLQTYDWVQVDAVISLVKLGMIWNAEKLGREMDLAYSRSVQISPCEIEDFAVAHGCSVDQALRSLRSRRAADAWASPHYEPPDVDRL